MEVDNSNDEKELIDSVCAFCGTEGGLKFETEKLCEAMEIKNDLGFCEMQDLVSDVVWWRRRMICVTYDVRQEILETNGKEPWGARYNYG